ncbi:hypothetical protein B0H19DRAFT_1104514, partial [Mycena capillaripes]
TFTHCIWAVLSAAAGAKAWWGACGSGTGDGRKNSAGRAQKRRRTAHLGGQHSAAAAMVVEQLKRKRRCRKIGGSGRCENSGAGARLRSHSRWVAQRGAVSERKRGRKIGGSGRCENNASRSHSCGGAA